MKQVFMVYKQIIIGHNLQKFVPMDFVYSQKEANRIHRLYHLQTPEDLRNTIVYDIVYSDVED